ncbi:MAG: DOMON domain-containing protein, partial [Thermoplasmatota archaeon]
MTIPFVHNASSGDPAPTRADPTIDGIIGASEYEDGKNIDEGKFEFYWTTTGGTIFIGMRGETEGYLSLGLDPVNLMTNADMIFGWVDTGGTPHIKDAYCTDDLGNHPEDTTFPGGTYDIDDFDGTESGGTTTIEFKRAMSTGDPYDKKFVNGTEMKIIWATSNDDDWTQEHDDADYDTMQMDGTAPPPPPPSDELDGIIEDGEYANSTSFDSGNFLLHWNINGTNITIGIEALATGWVSLGISPTTMMLDGDFIIGGTDGITPYAEDHYATTTTAHVLDTDIAGGSDDFLAYNSTESGGWTTLEVKRALSTGDPYDNDITLGDPLNIIWGVSGSDNIAAKHTKVGYGTWRVNASDVPPPPPPPKSDFDGIIESGEYENMTSVDSDRFEIHWTINGSSIDIGIRAQTTGYVSIGIDPTDRMLNADLIFGWVEGGLARSEDHFSTGATGPHSRDEDLGGSFDIISYNGTESGGWTTFEFRRNLTTDDSYDRTIKTDAAFPLIWAVADSDDPMATHSRRGTIMWNLSNATPPPPPPPPPPHISDFDGIITEDEYTDSKIFDQDRFELHWNVTGEEITIGLKAQAAGWISLGIDPSERMADADMYLGYHDGDPHLLDQFSTGPEGPHPEDTALGGTDDILDFNVTESGGWTTIEFRRNLTSDDQYDKSLNLTELMTIIWAVSDSDDPASLHTRRGTTTWRIMVNDTPEPPPPPPPKNTTLDGLISDGEYDDSASFGDGSFVVHWSINGSMIWMAMVGQSEGWVSIGFEPTTMMKDADMLIGWVDGGGPGLWDTYSTGELGPHPVDTDLGGTDDIIAFNGTESGGFTTIEFIRELTTGDSYDKDIPTTGSLNIIWGLGSSDDPESSHTQRGSGTILLYGDEPLPAEGMDGIVTPGEYKDSATFNFDNFRVYWTIVDDELHMAISAVTTGWIAIGFDPEDKKKDSDVILGWVENDVVHIIDAYATGPLGPHPPDTHLGGTTDILEFNGTEIDNITTIEFVRKLSTGDDFDKDIPTSGNLNIIWAYGDHDDFGESHSQRGYAVLTIGPGGVEPPDEAELDGIISDEEYDFNGTFGEGLILIYWKVEGDSIRMALQGKTTGWVSIGIDYSVQMADSDMIFGWVEND